jgi:hypothetical protein
MALSLASAIMVGALLGAGPAPGPLPSQAGAAVADLAARDVLSAADLVEVAALGQARDADLTPLEGKPFRVVVRPGQIPADGPRWWFDQSHQALSLHAAVGPLSGRFFRLPGCQADEVSAQGIEINRTRRDDAGSDIDDTPARTEERRISLGRLTCGPPADLSGLNVNINENRRLADNQVASLQVVIDGSLDLADGRSIVACEGERVPAGGAVRADLDIHQCLVGAVIRDIVFTTNGVELARWDAAGGEGVRNPSAYAMHLPKLQDMH